MGDPAWPRKKEKSETLYQRKCGHKVIERFPLINKVLGFKSVLLIAGQCGTKRDKDEK